MTKTITAALLRMRTTCNSIPTTLDGCSSNIVLVARVRHPQLPLSFYHSSMKNQRYFSTTDTTSASSSSSSNIDRLGLGSAQWRQMGKATYADVVRTALQTGITTVEAGLGPGADVALADALRQYRNQPQPNKPLPLQILWRIGYREVVELDSARLPSSSADPEDTKHDTAAESNSSTPKQASPQQQQQPLSFPKDVIVPSTLSTITTSPSNEDSDHHPLEQQIQVLHNLSPEYIQYVVSQSPLVELQQEYGPSQFQLFVMLHNPEAQLATDQQQLQDTLFHAFVTLQQLCNEGRITAFGVTSNGLCLPKTRPMHLDYRTVLTAAQLAAATAATTTTTSSSDGSFNSSLQFRVLQLPINALETTGSSVAKKIQRQKKESSTDSALSSSSALSNFQVYGMRPLTCYPDAGTGTARPFLLVDYYLPESEQWTNAMKAPPSVYQTALQQAVSHFDAQEILERPPDEWTLQDRETLDGCKLMQSLLHDLDSALDECHSLAANEDALYQQVIPLLQDTLETYDADTATVLQTYFQAYTQVVRYYVAYNTRQNLRHGETLESSIYDDATLPESKRLQEFGLEYVLQQTVEYNRSDDDGNNPPLLQPAIDKIILGCLQPSEVLDAVEIVRRLNTDRAAAATAGNGEIPFSTKVD